MNFHLSKIYLHALRGIAVFMLISIMLLWSCNTLTALFHGPEAQYKHAVAGLAIAYILGWVTRIASRRSLSMA